MLDRAFAILDAYRGPGEEINMTHNRLAAVASLLALGTAGVFVLSGCEVPHTSMAYASEVVTCGGRPTISASGSTAQANAMKRFVEAYGKACPGHTLNYTPNGSGNGISDFLTGKSDFAGSDTPLSADQYATAKNRCGSDAWNLPVVFGPLAVTYNLYNVDFLVLDAQTLAGIFNGSITRWNDPAITALNASMPPEDIKVVYRSDKSGSTANFQAYLQAASNGAWIQGTGKEFKGGVGTGAAGNEGTSAAVKNTEGAITYNELSFAMDEGLYAAEIKTPASRKSRRPVRIGTDSVGKTIAGAKIVGTGNDLVLDLSSFYNPSQEDVYPIVMATYEIVCSKYTDPQTGQAVKAALQAMLGPGQIDLDKHGYIPLPPEFQSRVSSAVNAIT
jgi:phosphate transport system substrate-binding protein